MISNYSKWFKFVQINLIENDLIELAIEIITISVVSWRSSGKPGDGSLTADGRSTVLSNQYACAFLNSSSHLRSSRFFLIYSLYPSELSSPFFIFRV